jgi:hypothetical protein
MQPPSLSARQRSRADGYFDTRPSSVHSGVAAGRALNPRFDLWNHSPTGFEWGYTGSGPAQLALALLADHLADDQEALEIYQSFKVAIVGGLHWKSWELTSHAIDDVLRTIRGHKCVQGGHPC